MNRIGLFYSQGKATLTIVEKIKAAFGNSYIKLIPIESVQKGDFESFENLIFGVSTWFDGELPACWDEILPEMKTIEMKGKRVAIFGLGDQQNYPENFVDGIGILAEVVEAKGAKLIGLTSVKGYAFTTSRAHRGNRFLGLALDVDNESEKTDERIIKWVEELKKELL